MPTYEYVCTKCGHQFDLFQSIKDKALTVCPREKCQQKTWGRGRVKKVISAGAGLIFKGSGFYITDYRSENYKQAAKKDTATSTPSGGDSKPAAGGDGKSASTPKSDAKPAKAAKAAKAA